jgi:hypothetical protein
VRRPASYQQLKQLVLLAPLAIGACYPEPLTTAETDVVVTVKDSERNYSRLKTYALPEEVFDLCEIGAALGDGGAAGSTSDDDQPSECKEVSHRYDDEVLANIADNLEELGFVEAANPDAADVVVLPGITAQDNWYVYYPYCDYWYSYYCWYYPWATTAVNYPIGTLVMYMLASKDADDATQRVPVAWLGVVRGILSSSTEANAERVDAGIDQAFDQSSYLGEGK